MQICLRSVQNRLKITYETTSLPIVKNMFKTGKIFLTHYSEVQSTSHNL